MLGLYWYGHFIWAHFIFVCNFLFIHFLQRQILGFYFDDTIDLDILDAQKFKGPAL